MKWIGQHIWDFISRFRSDVYLEATETGTIASGGNLGLDSNNKVVKATGVSSASTVTVTDSTTSAAFPVVFHDGSNSLLDDTGAFTYNPGINQLNLFSSISGGGINLVNNADDVSDHHINFMNLKSGAAGDNSDDLGAIQFYGKDDGTTTLVYGSFKAYIIDASDTDEAGGMIFKVATEGTEQVGLGILGDGASSKIDINLGYGAASTTTLAGGLTVGGSTAAMTNAGLLSVANQSSITGLGTIASGTWQGTAVASAYLDADTAHLTTNQTFTGIKTIVARRFTISSSTDHNYLGDIVTFGTAGGSLAQGDVCYLHTDASWVPALAGSDNAGTGKLLGIALGADPSADGMLLRGMITLDHNTGNSNDGEPIYLSTSSAGSVTSTLPNSSGNIVRILGYKMGDDDQVWFNPDSTYIERA
jgi:hypothetical protein